MVESFLDILYITILRYYICKIVFIYMCSIILLYITILELPLIPFHLYLSRYSHIIFLTYQIQLVHSWLQFNFIITSSYKLSSYNHLQKGLYLYSHSLTTASQQCFYIFGGCMYTHICSIQWEIIYAFVYLQN